MKTLSPLLSGAICLAVALVGGCATMRSARIQEHAELFAALRPSTQRMIRDGLIDFSFTPDMIYMALGTPNQVTVRQTESTPVETWTYRNFVVSGGAASKMGLNYPGMRYQGGSFLSTNVPSTGGGPQAPSISSTRASPWTGSLSDSGAPVAKLHVDLQDGKIVAMRLDR